MPTVLLSILIPLVVIAIVLVAGFTWYRRKIADLDPSTGGHELRGTRLTAERLHRMPAPPWRVVFEVGGSKLGRVDHVAIGPAGVIAIETMIGDRPTDLAEQPGEADTPAATASTAQLVADAAIARGDVDDLTRPTGAPCRLLARVYWGAPTPGHPAAIEVTDGLVAVEGQRLDEWLRSLGPGTKGTDVMDPEVLAPAQVDRAWQAVVTGIGRPDPLP